MARSEDVEFAQLVDWVEGRLSEREARAVAEQVATAGSATRADIAWLRVFAQIREKTIIASPPLEVRETLIERFEEYAKGKQHPRFLERLVATLTFESNRQPALGWRATTARSQRQFAYSTEAADITINLQPHPRDGLLDLYGHIFPLDSASPEIFGVQVLAGSSKVATTATDELGEFTFEEMTPDVYEMIVSSDRIEISIPQLDLRYGR